MTPDKVEETSRELGHAIIAAIKDFQGSGKGTLWLDDIIVKYLTQYHQDLIDEVVGTWYIGQTLNVYGAEHVVVGISTMVYDEDCEGEPEWKITDKIQEVAIAIKYNETSYQKPCWLKVSELEKALTEAQTIIKSLSK